ncbi:MAG: ion transporter [Campylobacteraceae bacterium]
MINIEKLQILFQKINYSNKFQFLVIAVIVISALAIGVHTYEPPKWLNNVLHVLDYSITIFFLIEIVIRYLAINNFKKFFQDGWNIFDTIVVLGSLVPIAGSTILLARLLRIFKILRLISIIPELRHLINSLLKAIPQMGYIALLMFILVYIYAVMGSVLFADVNEVIWGDVGKSLHTMFRVLTFDSWSDIMNETMNVYPYSWLFYYSFIFLGAFVFLNMMIGAILEVMTKETKKEKESKISNEDIMKSLEELKETINKQNNLK